MSRQKNRPRTRPSKHFGFNQVYDPLNIQWIPVWTLSAESSPAPEGMPTEATIFGQKYRIKYRKQIYSAPKKNARLAGIVIFSNRLIIIDPEQSIHEMRETLYHEICHVYLKACQEKDGRLQKITDAEVEGFCDLFGEAVVDLAVNNPLPRA